MDNDLFAEIVTNIDMILKGIVMLMFSLNIVGSAAIIGWDLRNAEGRRAVRARLAIEQTDPIEGLITMLAIPTLGLIVILCST